MQVNIKISKKVFNDIYIPYLENEDRYLIFYGGGSSGKSYFIAQKYISLPNKKNNFLFLHFINPNWRSLPNGDKMNCL